MNINDSYCILLDRRGFAALVYTIEILHFVPSPCLFSAFVASWLRTFLPATSRRCLNISIQSSTSLPTGNKTQHLRCETAIRFLLPRPFARTPLTANYYVIHIHGAHTHDTHSDIGSSRQRAPMAHTHISLPNDKI